MNLYSAKTLLQKGQILEARKIYKEVIRNFTSNSTFHAHHNLYHEALFGQLLTSFYLDDEDIEPEFSSCHELFAQRSSPELLLSLFQLMAEYYIEKRKYNSALKYIDEAVATLSRWQTRILQAVFQCYRIIILCRENLPHKAKNLLMTTEQQFSEEFFFHLLEGHMEVKAEIALSEGNCQAAQFLFEDAAIQSKKLSKFNEMMFMHRGAMACGVKNPKSKLLYQRSLELAQELRLNQRKSNFEKEYSKLRESPEPMVIKIQAQEEKPIKLYGFGYLRVFLSHKTEPLNKSDWQSEKARKLFLYLLLNKPLQCTKDKISDTIWPEMHDSKRASNSFHVTLSSLRKLLQSHDLITNNEGLYVIDTQNISIDWVDFQSSIDQGFTAERRANIESAYTHFKHAKSLYADDFLMEFSDDWIAERRDHFKKLLEKCLQHYERLLEEDHQLEDALALMEELIKINPNDDFGYQKAIQLSGSLGKIAMATDYYEMYRLMLKEEFGCSPSPSFIQMYDKYVLKH